MNFLLHKINQYLLNKSFKKAKGEADLEHKETGRKVFVILFNKDFTAITKQRLKALKVAGKISHADVDGIEKRALYTAYKNS